MRNSAQSPSVFSLESTPLVGSNLLEAGAGTGKTYSLSFLYLRLILEKGLGVEEILVTTFTIAATAELKSRIFSTIQDAEQALQTLCTEGATENNFTTQLLQQIRTQVADDEILKQRLRLALTQFDYAQIHTINGFALQLLREHADILECYSPENVLNDERDIVKLAYLELARDNFTLFGDSAADIGKAVTMFQSSEALFQMLTNILRCRDYIDNYLPTLTNKAAESDNIVKKLQQHDYREAVSVIAHAIEKKQLNGRSYPLKKLEQFSAQLETPSAFSDSKLLAFFARSQLLTKLNKDATAKFDHPFFFLCDELLEHSEGLTISEHLVTYESLLTLCDALSERIAALKAEQMVLTHDDIVAHVSTHAAKINTSLKAALIDEAQDTSLQQMELFSTLFLRKPDNIVFFVGDPKQAIYGFRGANIYSYLDIEKNVDNHYIMDTNYRSSKSLNDSINTFFGGNLPFGTKDISYHTIKSTEDNEHDTFGNTSLTFVEAENAGPEGLAETCAQTLLSMLNKHDLAPNDIAVLVRSGSQAERIKSALSQYGLSASLTGRMRVYETNEALLMLTLLRCIHSGNIRLIKSLLVTPLFDYSLTDLSNKNLVNKIATEIHQFAEIYEQNGLSVMFYRIMHQYLIPGRLLQELDGQRRLTNFIQLFELLQHALQEQALSLAGLCDYLNNAIHDTLREAELRLEGDSAITIMTMHNSKGLEFPVVCLPFFEYHYEQSPKDLLVNHQGQEAAPAFLKPQSLIESVKEQNAQETRRLAYVALTRAKYHNIIIRQPADTTRAIKYSMLTELLATLENPQQLTQASFISTPPNINNLETLHAAEKNHHYEANKLSKPLSSRWQLESFSRLQQQSQLHAAGSPTKNNQSEESLITGAFIDYPAGARPGTALHEMYEYYLENRINNTQFHDAISRSIEKYLLQHEKQQCPSIEQLAQAIEITTTTALGMHDFSLSDIDRSHQSIEMKFFMHLSSNARMQLLKKFGLNITHQHIITTEGYVHGYIDYCFEYDNKFYVLDYKSNRLGNSYHNYDRESMHQEMHHHHYDLQAFIYTLALCKHLGITNELEFNDSIGGYFYLFIRGMAENKDTGIYADKVDWNEINEFLIS